MFSLYAIAGIVICQPEFFLPEVQETVWFWFYPGDLSDWVRKHALPICLVFLTASACFPVQATVPQFIFMLKDIRHPAFSVRSAGIRLTGAPVSDIQINVGELILGDRTWHDLHLSCDHIAITRRSIECDAGVLRISRQTLSVTFQLLLQRKLLVLVIEPAGEKNSQEKWQLTVDWQMKEWQSILKVTQGEGKFLAGLLPQGEDWPQIHQAKLDGIISLSGYEGSISEFTAQLNIAELSFSDPSGLHAGEQISLQLDAKAWQQQDSWQWQGRMMWPEGEVFWQPFYFTGEGHQLAARGMIRDQYVSVEQGIVSLSGIGRADFSIEADISERILQQAMLSAENLELSTLLGEIIRPLAAGTALAETEAAGQASITWHYQRNDRQSLIIDLEDVSLTDTRRQFSFEGIDAHVPWRSNGEMKGIIKFKKGGILQIPLGMAQIPFETDGMQFRIPHLEIPVLDGKIAIENFTAALRESGWGWQFKGRLFPVSMEKLTEALQVQPMFGTLSGIIPEMSYANSIMAMEGVLVFDIFDGVAVARNLVLTEPFSRIPHLTMDMAIHHIDLDLLTRAYSFGNIQGRIDMEVNDLELVDWEPVRFDAKLVSSPGDYKRRISQAAIRNLTALGGGATVTAIQKSFLSFFEEFRYSEIGWRCRLRGHICRMGGIEPFSSLPDDEQGYVLVQGSGIPAITINGYNREVDWPELVKRLKHAIKSSNPVIH